MKAGVWKVLWEEKKKAKQKKARIKDTYGGTAYVGGSGSDTGMDEGSPPTVVRGEHVEEEEEEEEDGEAEGEGEEESAPGATAAESLVQLSSPGVGSMPIADGFPVGIAGGPYQPPPSIGGGAFDDTPLKETPKKKKMESPPEGWDGGLAFPFWLKCGPLGKGLAMFESMPPGKAPKAEGRAAFRAKEKDKKMDPDEDEEKDEPKPAFNSFKAKKDPKVEKLEIQKKAANTHELEVYSQMVKDKVRTRQATSHEWLSQEELEEDQWGVGWFLDEVDSGRA